MCRKSVVEFRDGRDMFSLPWKQPAKAFCTNGALRVEGRQSAVYIEYASFPGPKPFRGPRTVRLVAEGAGGGEAELLLKNRDSGKVESRKAPCSAIIPTAPAMNAALMSTRAILPSAL